jgi:hypothetical protein
MICALKMFKTCRSAQWSGTGTAAFPSGPFALAKVVFQAFGVETHGRQIRLKDCGDYWFCWLDEHKTDVQWDEPIQQGRLKIAVGRCADGAPG